MVSVLFLFLTFILNYLIQNIAYALPLHRGSLNYYGICPVIVVQRCIVKRQFYFSYKQVKHDYSLLRAYAVSCGRFNKAVNRDYLNAQNRGKLASVCLQQFSSIFETTIQL